METDWAKLNFEVFEHSEFNKVNKAVIPFTLVVYDFD